MARLRIGRTTWPRRALVLTDTPRPNCRTCQGEGHRDYGPDETDEYGGTDGEPCPCWDETRRRTLLPLPRHSPGCMLRRGVCTCVYGPAPF